MRLRTSLSSIVTLVLVSASQCPLAYAQPAPAPTVGPEAAPAPAEAVPAPGTPAGAVSEAPAVEAPSPAVEEPPPTAADVGVELSPSAAAESEPPTMIEPAPAGDFEAASAAGWGDLAEGQDGLADTPVFRAKLYGFIDTHLEKVAHTPDSVDENGKTVYAANPYELDIPNLHAMVQGSIYDRYRFYLNLASPGSGSNSDDEPLYVRNAWVELPLITQYLNLRAGKMYRRFGLYNEILDAVPTFIGIEPPEIFDKDHLMLTRTTTLMLHGSADVGAFVLNYSATTGNDERSEDSVPFGADVYAEFPFGLRFGSSFYTTGGDAVPSRGVGDGSPRGGVVNWMTKDRYYVVGGYAQLKHSGVIAQVEYWRANHKGTRDADALMVLADEGGLNPQQMRRFFRDGDPTNGAITKAKYGIDAFYVRLGYEITVGELASVTPYLQLDVYSNPETINKKSLGGDNEAGLTDDGKFEKYTVGAVIRPVPQVAFKIDGSGHRQKFNGASEFYPEIRLSLSYLWELAL